MSTYINDMVKQALDASVADRRYVIEELEYVLRNTDRAVAPPVNTVELVCTTCGYVSESGGVEQRDAQHMRYDGAHYAHWAYEREADAVSVRSDLDLAKAMIEEGLAHG